jgi:hypothetical protein
MLYIAGVAGLTRSPGQGACSRIAAAALGATPASACSARLCSARTQSAAATRPEHLTLLQDHRDGDHHNFAAAPIFLELPAAAFACAWRFKRSGRPSWAAHSAATGASMLTTTGLFGAGFNQDPRLVNYARLLQRAAIVTAPS